MDSRHGTRSKPKHKSKKSTESFAGDGDVFASLNSLEDPEHERVHSSLVTNDDSDVSTSDRFFASAKRFKSSSFNSLSSSDLPSDDDSTQLNPPKVTFSTSFAGSPRDVQVHPHTKYKKLDVLPENDNHHYTDSQVNSKVKPVTESPPVQMMERPPPGFDPKRIPESIFTSKPSGPMDWSVASNESLFSIRIGNSSFSKDRTVSVPKEVPQSGEAEVSKEVGKAGEQIIDSGNPPAEVAESDSLEEYYEVESKISQPEELTDDITIIGSIPGQIQDDPRIAKPATPEPSSKVNANVKPEITQKKKKSSECCCSDCSCEFCCSVKLRCCFCKWPGCKCCQPSDCNNCCNWHNCCKWPNCKSSGCTNFCSFKCCKWPTCNNCCSFKSCSNCCNWSCENCCKWPSCSSCKGCKWPSCFSCGGCSNCCNWSCKNCCKWPSCKCFSSCSCTNCCKCPSFNCFSSCSCTSCKWPSCSWPKGCCKWPSCSGCSCKWRQILCCFPKTSRKKSRRSKRTCGWFSSIFCC